MWAHARETSREPSGIVGKVAHGAPVDFELSIVEFGGEGAEAYMLMMPEKGSKVQ